MNLDEIFRFWIVPPLLGVFIGYFTNWLAIKMLFRPLREIRFLGCRIPFTPGILPRERDRLAESIGDSVAQDLLTEDVIIKRLGEDDVKNALNSALRSAISTVLSGPVRALGKDSGNPTLALIKEGLSHAIGTVTASTPFREALHSLIDEVLMGIFGLSLDQIVPRKELSIILSSLNDSESASAITSRIADFVELRLQKISARSLCFSSFLPQESVLKAYDMLFSAVHPFLLKGASTYLDQKEVRLQLEKAAREIVMRSMDRFSGLQRFVIKMGKFDESVMDMVPAVVKDLSASVSSFISDSGNRDELKNHFSLRIIHLLTTPVDDLVSSGELDFQKLGYFSGQVLWELLHAASQALPLERTDKPEGPDTDEPTSMASLLALFGDETQTRIVQTLVDGIFTALLDPGTLGSASRLFSGFSTTFVKSAQDRSLGEIFGISEELEKKLSQRFSEDLIRMLIIEISPILKSVDIRKIVIEKIRSLDMLDIERMVLRVIDKELVWITVLGGILGGILGVGQSVFMVLGR